MREKQNVSITQMAQHTRISVRHLQSLEEAAYGRLPGGMYNRAILRAYCDCLGVDPGDYLRRYEREITPIHDEQVKPRHAPRVPIIAPKSHPIAIWTCGLLIAVAALYASKDWIASIFSPYLTRPVPELATITVIPTPPGASRGQAAASADDLQAAEGDIALLQARASVPASPAETGESNSLQGALRLSVEVVDDCWISLHSDGSQVLVRLLKPGEGHTYAATERFYVVIGNAAGVQLKINGMPLKSLGEPGRVVRLAITEQNLHELLAKSTG